MKIILPRGLEVDLDDIPVDLEEQVQKCFAEYTKGTNPKYMYHDKMLFIDVMAKRAHGGKDPEDTVMDAMKDVPVRMISYGGSNYNISFLIREEDKKRALQSLSDHLFA